MHDWLSFKPTRAKRFLTALLKGKPVARVYAWASLRDRIDREREPENPGSR